MVVSINSKDTDVVNAYNLQEKASSVGRQSFADKWREIIPALRELYPDTYVRSITIPEIVGDGAGAMAQKNNRGLPFT